MHIPQHIPSTSQTLNHVKRLLYSLQGTIIIIRMLLLREYPDQYCLYSNFWGTSLKLTYELEAISSRRYVGGITHPVAKRYIVSIFALFLHFHFSLKNFCVAAITLEGGEPRPSSWLARASATLTTCCAVGKCHPACGSVCVCRRVITVSVT